MTRRTNKKAFSGQVDKLLSAGEVQSLQDIVIFQEADGTYSLFNKYTITKAPDGGFDVTIYMSDQKANFNSLKNATTWCIFDKRGKYTDANRIASLDFGLGAVNVDIQIHQRMMQNATSVDNQLIYIAKLNEDRVKKTRMSVELTGYVNESVHWQNTRFTQKPVY